MSELFDNAKLYFAKAESKLESAKLNLSHEQYDDAVSRAYYSAFHSISALLFLKELEFSSHSQTLGSFNKEFIKTEVFPRKFGKWIYKLFEFRETGDYAIISNITRKDAIESIEHAEEILKTIQEYVNKNFI